MEVQLEEGVHDSSKNWGGVQFRFRSLLGYVGPGLIMCIAFVDPGNLESDLLTGAVTGYSLLWMIPLCSVVGLILQQFAAKLGVVTGKHLAQVCYGYYPRITRYLVWIMMEIAVISADIQEVIGSAIAIKLLSWGRIPLYIGIIITAFDTFILLFLGWLGAQKLEMFFGLLIAIMCAMFGVIYFKVGVPHLQVLGGLVVPELDQRNLSYAVGMLGALIMPHNIYLHSAVVLSRFSPSDSVQYKREAVRYAFAEAAFAIILTVFINVFVVAVFAKGFFGKNLSNIGLMSAGQFLYDEFGSVVVTIWALGLLAAGQASTMSGTYTGQFVMSGFINLKMSPFLRVTLTRAITIVPTLLVVIFSRSANALDTLNQYINLLQALQLPFALLPIIGVTNDENIMGEFKNKWWEKLLLYIFTAAVIGINLYSIALQEIIFVQTQKFIGIVGMVFIIAYLIFVTYLIIYPFIKNYRQEYNQESHILDELDIKRPLLNGPSKNSNTSSTSDQIYNNNNNNNNNTTIDNIGQIQQQLTQ